MFAELRCKPFETEKKPTILESPKSNLHGLANISHANDQILPLDLHSAADKNGSSSEEPISDHESEQNTMEIDLNLVTGCSPTTTIQCTCMYDDIAETITAKDNIFGRNTDTRIDSNIGTTSAIESDDHHEDRINSTEQIQSDGYEPGQLTITPTRVRGTNIEAELDSINTLHINMSSDGCEPSTTTLTTSVIGSNSINVEQLPSGQTPLTNCDGLQLSHKCDTAIHVMGLNTNVTGKSSVLTNIIGSNSTTVSNVSTIKQLLPLKLLASKRIQYGTVETFVCKKLYFIGSPTTRYSIGSVNV